MHEFNARKVAIRAQFDPDTREWLWAMPIDVDKASGAGTYQLLNTAFFTPFVLDDTVAVKRKGRDLFVVGLLEASTCEAYEVRFLPFIDSEVADALLADWQATGTWIEGDGYGCYFVTVRPNTQERPTRDELETLQDTIGLSYADVRDAAEDLSIWPPERRERSA